MSVDREQRRAIAVVQSERSSTPPGRLNCLSHREFRGGQLELFNLRRRLQVKNAPKSVSVDAGSGRTHPDWLILAVVCVAQFMVVLDVSVVNVALPSIKASLGFTQTGLQWILNAYTLTFAGFLLLGGRAADIYGRKRIYLVGMVLFTLASLVGGFATSQSMLVIARAVQGLGGAILSPATLTIITTTFTDPKARAKALGAWSAVAGAGGAVGALLGGVLTQLVSWRWILFINVPVGIVAFVAAVIVLTEVRRSTDRSPLDIVGAISVTGGLTLVVYGLVSASSSGWGSSTTLGSFAVAVLSLAWFVFHEARVAKSPLMPLGLFKKRSVTSANLVMLCVGGSLFASWYFLSLYFQEVRGYSPMKTGLVFLPQTLAIIVGAQISSRLTTKLGPRRILLVGTLLTAIGLALTSTLGVDSPYLTHVLVPSILITLGAGLSFSPLAFAATSGVKAHEAGLASGLLNTSRQVGGSIGLAGLATVAASSTTSYLHKLPLDLQHTMAAVALTHGFMSALRISAVVALLGTVASLSLPTVRRPAVEQSSPVEHATPEIAFGEMG